MKYRVVASTAVILMVLAISCVFAGTASADAGDLFIASTTPAGAPSLAECYSNSVGGNGRYVCFSTWGENFPGANGYDQVYRKDMSTGALDLVSCTATGEVGVTRSDNPGMSADGRYVVFSSDSTNFPGGVSEMPHVYRKDMNTGAIDLVSCTAGGTPGTSYSEWPAVNYDGRYVVFVSDSDNFPGSNGQLQIYRKDLTTGALALVSENGGAGSSNSFEPHISSDGRYATAVSNSANFPSANGQQQVYRKDMNTGALVLASSTAGGAAGLSSSVDICMSADGNSVVMRTDSSNFPGPPDPGVEQIFRKNMTTGALELASCTGAGVKGDFYSEIPSVSSDGRYVTFDSSSTNFPGFFDNYNQIYRKDMKTGELIICSTNNGGASADYGAMDGRISPEGAFVSFYSDSDNFPEGHGDMVYQVYVKQLDNLVPTTTSIDPSRAAAGDPGLAVTVNGANFAHDSTARWNGSDRPTTFVSSSQVRCDIAAGDIKNPGDFNITVSNPSPGGGESNPQVFTVEPSPTAAFWLLAEGTNAWGFDTYITIENPNVRQLTARLTYLDPNPAAAFVPEPPAAGNGVVATRDIALPALSQTTVSSYPDIGTVDFSTTVECLEGETISVDRTMYWTGEGASAPEAHCSVGASAPATTWYLPEGSSAWGFETWTLVLNPNDAPANLTLTYMTETGPVAVPETVPANSRATFSMVSDIGEADASIQVASDLPVVAERSMYRNDRREGSCSVGTTAKAESFYLAEGTTAWGFTTYLLIQNPNDAQVEVTVFYLTPEGPVQKDPFTMDPNTRRTIRVNDVEGVTDTDTSIQVFSPQGIIAERAMYWDNGTGEACHDSIGLAAPHRIFMLPDGQTSEGWQTYTLVQNPNETDVDIRITYLPQGGGSPVTFTDNLPADTRRTYVMSDKIESGRASVLVQVTDPAGTVMVERSMYKDGKSAGTDTIGGFVD